MTDELTDREKARLAYETTPALFSEVAESLGVSERTVLRWSASDGGWRKIQSRELAQQVEAKANAIAEAKAEREAVLSAEARDVAIDLRVAVIEKHRTELQDVRRLIEEATLKKDAATARLASEICKTVDLLQKAERRSWGLDVGEGANGNSVVVVIERGP